MSSGDLENLILLRFIVALPFCDGERGEFRLEVSASLGGAQAQGQQRIILRMNGCTLEDCDREQLYGRIKVDVILHAALKFRLKASGSEEEFKAFLRFGANGAILPTKCRKLVDLI